jgi:hypothetical protein
VLHSERCGDGEVVHPFLAAIGAVFARWDGREGLHAGAFLTDRGAWAILGGKEGGKSSLLACLAMRGHPVLSDDLLVIEGTGALAGPRCVDLRPDAAEELALTGRTRSVREGERRRLALDPVPLEVPLCGFVWLAWGGRPSVGPVAPAARIGLLASHRTILSPPGDALTLLDLAALPAWRLERPPEWSSLDVAVERLLAATAAL